MRTGFTSGKLLRAALLLCGALLVIMSMSLLVAHSSIDYACLVVPVGANKPEWTLDVAHGFAVWDNADLGAPVRYVQSSSPDGRYQLGSFQRSDGETLETFDWRLEDTQTGVRTPLAHSAGYEMWSADSRTLAYVTLPFETPRQFTVVDLASGAAHTQPVADDLILGGLSADGRYLLLAHAYSVELHVLRTADMRQVARSDESQPWISVSWSSHGNRLVFFVDAQPTLYDFDAGTSAVLDGVPLPIDETSMLSTYWAPNSERFALFTQHADNSLVLNLFDADGQPLSPPLEMPGPLLPLAPLYLWSADSARFAVLQADALSVIDVATGRQETLVSKIERTDSMWRGFFPTPGAYQSFVHASDDGQALTILDLRTLTITSRLIDGAARIAPPVWTDDASRIAVKWDDAAGRTRLTWTHSGDFVGHLLDEPGQFYGEDTPLTSSAFWLDSGTTLLYTAERGGDRGIYVANVDTGETHAIATGLMGDDPFMTLMESPKGDRFAMSYRPYGTQGSNQFVLFTLDGRYTRALPSSSYVMPIWSPDSRRIAHRDTTSSTIRIFDADGNLQLETTSAPPEGGFEWTQCRGRRSE